MTKMGIMVGMGTRMRWICTFPSSYPIEKVLNTY